MDSSDVTPGSLTSSCCSYCSYSCSLSLLMGCLIAGHGISCVTDVLPTRELVSCEQHCVCMIAVYPACCGPTAASPVCVALAVCGFGSSSFVVQAYWTVCLQPK